MIAVYITFISICVFFVLVANIRTKSLSFYLGSEHYGAVVSAASIVAAFTGGSAIVNTTGLAGQYGLWAFFDVLPSVLGLLICALFVKIKFFGKTFSANFFNVEGALYDKRAITVHYAQVALLYTLVIAAQLRAIATFASELNIPVWLGIGVCCLTVAAYASRGFDSVTRTDVAQLFLMLPMYIILAHIAFEPQVSIAAQPSTAPASMPFPLAIALCLPFFFLPISQEIHQRGAAADSEKTVGRSYLLAAITYLILASLLVITFKHSPKLGLVQIIKGANPVASILVAIGVLSAILSTLDTSTNIASHAVEQLPYMKSLDSAKIQVLLLVIGSILFLFFPTVLSLILFALFVYMAGPALSFIAIYLGLHPKHCAIVGALFVALQTTGQFKPSVFTHLPFMPSTIRNMDTIQIGLIFLILQIITLGIMRVYRRLT